MFTSVLSFPLEQVAFLLRILSLSGSAGNVLAIIMYAGLCLFPTFFLLAKICKRKMYSEDFLLALISAYLFVALYYMINPQLLPELLGKVSGNQQMGNALLSCGFYSLLTGYAILHSLRLIQQSDRERLQKILSAVLIVMGILFAAAAFGTCLSDYRESVQNLQTDLSIGSYSEKITKTFLLLQYLMDALPYILDVVIVFYAHKLLKGLLEEPYSCGTLEVAEKFSMICRKSLVILIFVSMGWNLLQLFFAKKLYVVNVNVSISVFSIAFVLVCYLMVQFVKENKALKDDNELFI